MIRASVAVTAALLVALTATACNATKRELTVVFGSDASRTQQQAALHACTGVAPHTSPEPMPTPGGHFTAPGVRFRIDSADDRDIAALENCLGRQPGVRGFQDSSDNS